MVMEKKKDTFRILAFRLTGQFLLEIIRYDS